MNTGQASGEGSAATGDGASGFSWSSDIPPLDGLPPLGENHAVVETAVRLLLMRIETTAGSLAKVLRDTEVGHSSENVLRRRKHLAGIRRCKATSLAYVDQKSLLF